ncbi:hypothetical protein [Zavarzinia compransoris]|uniref:Uncharacterized protein n=1 Tax=Zavarzinia compransoris TaxID=1264899 RepID=A0A317E1K7_9PROT|nr:hypothetical protein [Zavarzinia compransoris]PWR20006.1 hypothetical protein DKG75_16330 [Zavarzinia compransoris]TDP44875.1 hypothetical protein DES42_10694 [Zavarzinia compransoris]
MSLSRRHRALIALTVAALALAGCSGRTRLGRLLGHPPPAKALVPPAAAETGGRMLSGVPVLVTPTSALSSGADGRPALMAAAIARALVEKDILATTRNAASQSYVLTTAVEGSALAIALSRPDGIAAGRWQVPLPGPAATIDGAVLDRVAAQVAAAVTGTAATAPAPRPAAPAAAPAALASVVVTGVGGAPGDGNRSLAAAMRQALAIGGLAVLDKPAEGSLSVTGTVTLTPITPRIEKVTLSWEVRRGGEVIATIDQENQVPAGSLNHSWGPIAGAAAQGGADGILQLVHALRGR